MLDIVTASMKANDERCWSATYRCARSLITLLESWHVDNPTGEWCPGKREVSMMAELFECALDRGQRNQHSLIFASIWLESIGASMNNLGLELMHQAPIVLPLLMEWARALLPAVRHGSLECILVYLQQCWPRNVQNARILWDPLEEVYSVVKDDKESASLLVEIAELLMVTGGDPSAVVRGGELASLVA